MSKTYEEKVAAVKTQMKQAVETYMKSVPKNPTAKDVGAALLSGISLTSNYLAANDGSSQVSPQITLDAVKQVAAEWGLQEGNLKDGS